MTTQNNVLKRRIMRRVYLLWGLRLLLHPVTAKTALVTVLAWKSTDFVSYSSVLANLPNALDVQRQIAFLHDAIVATDGATMFVLTMIGVFATWLMLDIVHRKQAYI
jgi:hypothetical protein